jgi:hypothetical protein
MAAVTGDILALLDKIPIWKRVQEAPARIDALEKRIAELEAKLARAPGEVCPACGDHAMRVKGVQPARSGLARLGVRDYAYECESCGFKDVRTLTPTQQIGGR